MTGNETAQVGLISQIFMASSMSIFFLVDVFGNTLVLIAIATEPKLHITSNIYLFALAVTDILIGLTTMLPTAVSVSLQGDFLPFWACTLFSFIDSLILPLSLWILAGSSLDRCIMIYRPLQYKNLVDKKKTYIVLAVLIAMCSIFCFPILLPKIPNSWSNISYSCAPDFFAHPTYFAAYMILTFPFPLLIVIISYGIIFSVVTSLHCKLSRQKIRATMTVLVVIVCLLMCVLPVTIRALYFFIKASKGQDFTIIRPLENALHWNLYLHSSLNPCIYALLNPQFQRSFKRILFRKYRSQRSSMCETTMAAKSKIGDYTEGVNVTRLKVGSADPDSVDMNSSVKSKSRLTDGREESDNRYQDNGVINNVKCSIIKSKLDSSFLGLRFSKLSGKAGSSSKDGADMPPISPSYVDESEVCSESRPGGTVQSSTAF